MRRSYLSATVLLCGILATTTSRGADQEPERKPNLLMEKKLEYSQGLLQALVNGDYDEARRNAKLMKTFTRLEQLYQGKNPEYAVQLKEFQATTTALSSAIDEKKLGDASKAYGAMIQSCVKCHEVIREGQ